MSLLSMTRGMTQHLHCFLDLIVYGGKLASFNAYSYSFIFTSSFLFLCLPLLYLYLFYGS
ncbi:hypothetical protein BDV10DRAFT_164709 [Aspergillus recurvatus]